MKKTIRNTVLIVLAMAIVASVSIFGTLAWLSDEEGAVNVMTLGNVYIDQNEYEYNANGELVEFTQGKPLLPVVGTNNVVEKIVTVTNTGSTGAYVRTLFAFEKGTLGKDSKTFAETVSMDINTTDWTWGNSFEAEIAGNTYVIMEAVYNKVLLPGQETPYSLNKVWMNAEADNEEVNAVDGNGNKMYDILVFSQAIQSTGFESAAVALNEGFGVIGANDLSTLPWDASFVDATKTTVTNTDEFKAALTSNAPVIVVDLAENVSWDVAAWSANGMGGENTQVIIINGNGNDVTFNLTDSDWTHVNTNGAKLVINDATIKSSGYNTGHWKRNHVMFNCDVELNNVEAQAIGFEDDAVVNNSTIVADGDNYAIWITAEGQTVTLNNVTVAAGSEAVKLTAANADATGRGIKIADEDVKAPAKVTLNVNGAEFFTGKKAAILVSSKAGADITLTDVDLYGVVADPINSVWVDEDWAAYADKVTVKGGSSILEGNEPESVRIEDPADVAEALKNVEDGAVVVLGEGTFDMNNASGALKGKDVTIIGNGETSVPVTKIGTGGENCDYSFDGSNVTFENVVITTNSSTYIGYARCKATYNNCTFNGTFTTYDDSVFNNCTFNVSGDVYNLWTWGAPNVTLNDCTFNSDGKAVLLYGGVNTNLVVNGCTFNDNGGLTDKKAAIEVGNDYNKSYTLTVNNTVVNGYEINDKGTYTGTTIYGNKNSMPADKLVVTIDGVNVSGKVAIASVNDMVAFANAVNVTGNSFSGKTVVLVSDIDLKGINWTPIGNSTNAFKGTFDGNDCVISNLNCVHEGKSNIGLFGMTTDGHIKNVTVENAIVTGRLNVGVVAGTPYTSKYTNITVKGHVEVNGMAYVGAVGGKNCYANWDQITVNVDGTSYVKADSVEDGTAYRTYVGGVIGFMGEGSHTVSNVNSNIDVIGSTIDVGGIVGIAHYGNNFVNVVCSGDVTLTGAMEAADAEEMGGIAGVWHNGGSDVTFENCTFTGTLSANITEGVDLSDNNIVGNAYSASGSGNLIIK